MDELVPANRNRDVRRTGGDCAEKEQVTRFELVLRDRPPGPRLFQHRSRHGDAVLPEDIVDEPAAIETGRIRPAVAVGRSAER